MSDKALTWDNIPGLTDEERRAGRKLLNVSDLRQATIEGNIVDGVRVPTIVNGVLIR